MKLTRKKFMFFSSIVLALMFVLSSVAVFAADGEGIWTTKASMITERYNWEVAVVDGKIYAIGGHTLSNMSKSVEEYNPSTDTWVTKASMSTARREFEVAVIDGKIYAVGGYNTSNGSAYLNSVEEYNPLTDTWTTKASMNTARSHHKLSVLNGKIYAIGGFNGDNEGSCLNSVEEYNPTANSWIKKASMSIARSNPEVAVIDGKIYAIGGNTRDGSSLNTVEEYNPATNSWTTKASMAAARSRHEVVVVDGKVYAIGGYNAGHFNSVEEYNLVTDIWTTKAPMTTARSEFQVSIIDNKIYCIGGIGVNNSILNSVEEYNPATNAWRAKASMTASRRDPNAAVLHGKIYAIGGTGIGIIALSSVEEYTPGEPSPSVPTNLTASAGVAKVDLSWTASQGATNYNIKRATTIGGPYTTIVTSSAITFTDTTAANGTTYYYVVTAVNSGGESANSNEVSAAPINPDVSLKVISVDKAKVGDEILANIVIHNAINICAEDIKIAFDTTRLEFVCAENADGIKIYKEDDLLNGIRRYITASLGKANAANGDKILLKLTFKAKAIGEAKIDIVNGRIADNATLEEDVEEENCGEKIVLIEAVKDVNRTGEFTLLDLGIDAWYYGDTVADTDATKYDTDVVENGTIDNDDLTEIVKHILNNKNYPKQTQA